MTKQTLGLCSLAVILTIFFLTGSVLYGQGNTGQLKVNANPGRAGVFVDGKYLGPAANFAHTRTYSVAAGEHELVLREPRYEEYKTTVKIDAGKTTSVSQALQARTLAKPPFGRLRVVGFEKFAPVYVNGMFMGHADEFNAPGQGLLLNPGDYELKIASQSGSTVLEQKITIKQDVVETVKAKS
jgi:PEGA domain-containing protein